MTLDIRATVDQIPVEMNNIINIIVNNFLFDGVETLYVRVKALTPVQEELQSELSLKFLAGIWETAPIGKVETVDIAWETSPYSKSKDSYELRLTVH